MPEEVCSTDHNYKLGSCSADNSTCDITQKILGRLRDLAFDAFFIVFMAFGGWWIYYKYNQNLDKYRKKFSERELEKKGIKNNHIYIFFVFFGLIFIRQIIFFIINLVEGKY